MDHVKLGRLLLGNGGIREDLLEAVRSERARLWRARWRRAAIAAGVVLSLALIAALVARRGPAPVTPKPVEVQVPVVSSNVTPLQSYDFRDATQMLDWEYLAHRGARAQFPYDMSQEGETVRLRNGEAVHVAKFRGEARISATLWQESAPASPCFGVFVGPISWAVVTDDSTALRPRAGGPHILTQPSTPPPVGTRLRVEMSVAGGRATCTVDGRVVCDQPMDGDEPIEVGVFAFRDTLIGFDDVAVDGNRIR